MGATHEDAVCRSASCQRLLTGPNAARNLKIQSKLAQRAQRQATGYYCGYTFKGQPVGKKFLRAAAESLNYLKSALESKTTEGQRWHRLTHTVFTDFQHRSMLRTAAEEWNLASNFEKHDVRAAEFVRTYQSQDFPGLSADEAP